MDYTSVSKPSRYVGGEYGMPLMKKDAAVRFCMCFPDVYEVGMSNLGMRILYYILNREEDVVCERCFAPWKDCGDLLRSEGETLRSLDTKRPLKEFDFLGFSLQYELCYSNVLYMLDLAGIPFRHKDRSESDPIIVTGGPCVVNPAPITAFADVVFVGEGEEGMVAICKVLKKMKAEGKSKTEILKAIDEVVSVRRSIPTGSTKESLCRRCTTSNTRFSRIRPWFRISKSFTTERLWSFSGVAQTAVVSVRRDSSTVR